MRLWKKSSTADEGRNRGGQTAPRGDPALPGSAGYQGHRRASETTPSLRFNFVRPDGKPKPEGRKG